MKMRAFKAREYTISLQIYQRTTQKGKWLYCTSHINSWTENLKVTRTNMGDSIMFAPQNLESGHYDLNNEYRVYFKYPNDFAFYTWAAAQEVCPSGWHLSSDVEWKTLERYIGISENEIDNIGWRGNFAFKLVSRFSYDTDLESHLVINETGFSAIASFVGGFQYYNYGELRWADDEYIAVFYSLTDGLIRYMKNYGAYDFGILRDTFSPTIFIPLRCVKD